MRRCIAAFMLVAGLFGTTPAYSSTIDFTAAYDVSNWTAIVDGGSIRIAGAPFSVSLESANMFAGGSQFARPSKQDFLFTAFETATISFAWSYSTNDMDGPYYDPFGWLLNGDFTSLTGTLHRGCLFDVFLGGRNPECDQSGMVSFLVDPGDVFGFRAASLDSAEGPAITTVSNFSATTPVPEPSTFILLGSGCLFATWRRFRWSAI